MRFVDRVRAAAPSWLLRRDTPARQTREDAGTPTAPDWTQWLLRRSGALPLYGPIEPAHVSQMAGSAPEVVRRILLAADNARAHSFVLLGRGPYTPDDPERPPRAGYQPIDWRLDPGSRLRFPAGFSCKSWSFPSMCPPGADIKLPWELARCYHWVNLAQAWRLTGDSGYPREVQCQCEDFLESNPVGVGIHWTCTMDVAIRAVNWVLAWELLEGCAAVDSAFRLHWASALYDHGTFIRANLEDKYEVTSNHYLSNVVGLFFLGVFFAGTPAGDSWKTFARAALEQEMIVQVQADGSDFESSVPYHRLVTELFLGCARVAQVHGPLFSSDFYDRLRRMIGFLLGVLRPDGLMPQIGDADDGRLHVFEGMGQWSPQNPMHVFAPAAYVLGEASWAALAGPRGSAEAVWWGFPWRETQQSRLPHVDLLHTNAGIAVSRNDAIYLAITNGIVGTRGFGNHKHNDLLSFEFHTGGNPWFVDPGSYVYTPDPESRNLFRSVRSHNTLRIDDIEQNEMNPEWLFRLFERAAPDCVRWVAQATDAEYEGRHEGFVRDGGPAHQRRFHLVKAAATLNITDALLGGTGERRVTWHFHCAPGTTVRRAGDRTLQLVRDSSSCLLRCPVDDMSIGDGWYSPSYGVRVPCATIDVRAVVKLPDERRWRFSITPR